LRLPVERVNYRFALPVMRTKDKKEKEREQEGY
jgi:hypothetical protein